MFVKYKIPYWDAIFVRPGRDRDLYDILVGKSYSYAEDMFGADAADAMCLDQGIEWVIEHDDEDDGEDGTLYFVGFSEFAREGADVTFNFEGGL